MGFIDKLIVSLSFSVNKVYITTLNEFLYLEIDYFFIFFS
jgi:hypothetical protein